MSNASSVTFPESLDELENTSTTAQISIPYTLLLDRKAGGGRCHGGHASDNM